jgi:hypothetical protein
MPKTPAMRQDEVDLDAEADSRARSAVIRAHTADHQKGKTCVALQPTKFWAAGGYATK